MRRVNWVILAIFGILWAGMVFLVKFPPSEEEIQLRYLAVSAADKITVPGMFAWEMPFPLPKLMLSVIPAKILLSNRFFRLPNLVTGLLALTVLSMLIYRSDPKLTGKTLVIAALTPWMIWVMISDFPAILTFILALMAFSLRNKKWFLIPLLILAGLTSFPGLVFCLVFGIWLMLTTKKLKEKAVILLLTGLIVGGISYHLWTNISEQSFIRTSGITLSSISDQVDQRVRYEFKLNDYRDIIPLGVKRLAYNKIFYGYRILTGQLFNVFSLEKLAFPGEGDATVTRSMWNSKGLPWLLFWELILVIWGMFHLGDLSPKLKSLCSVFFVWGSLTMYLTGNNFLQNGIGIVIPVAVVSAAALAHIPKIVLYIGGLVVLMGLTATYHYFLFNELYWRDNRPQVHTKMAQMAVKYHADFVTTILGRSFLYYAWLLKMPPRDLWQATENGNVFGVIKFAHFELKNKSPSAGQVYVGFPGEFLGNKKLDNRNDFKPEDLPKNYQLLDTYRPHDTVSFGNGDEIWTVKIN